MKALKYFLSISFLLAVVAGCKKDVYDDVSLVGSEAAPDKLSAMFDISQDNSGLVTITPNGEGASRYEVHYGDAATNPATVLPGKNTQHNYAEGTYNVKIVGHTLSGKTAEATQQLTVSFRAPENLEVTADVDPANNFKVNVTAKALYETMFKVYFGDVANEVPETFLEGATISHTYASVGDYTVKVIAFSGGAATTEFTKTVSIVNPVLLPITFESATIDYSFANFGGGDVAIIDNPQSGGINTSAKVGRMVKHAPEVWGGSVITLGEAIDFSTNKVFRMKVFSPRVGAKVLLKVENAADGGISFEKEVATTVANDWEDLVFDYNAINTANSYHKVVLIFELGTVGDGSANFTFLFDDIRLTNTIPGQVALPLGFESGSVNYTFLNFDGGDATVIDNPQASGINTSSKVVRMIKNAGQPWGGSLIKLSEAIDFSSNKIFRMKVFSPRAGARVLLKVENAANGGISYEKEETMTVANAWEDLVFDYSAINTANEYNNIVLIFDLGTQGDGSANFTFLLDDIRLTNSVPNDILLPLSFESSTLTYTFNNFDGGDASVVSNPDASGINTSSKVGKMIKNAGQPWGGSWIGLTNAIDFTTQKTFKMKVYSPRAGAKVLLKVENQANGGISYEKEVLTTTANTWEELVFDYSGVNTAESYQKIVLIFDLGTPGDGSTNFTWYFDDITLN